MSAPFCRNLVSRRAINVAPTVQRAASGAPVVPGLNLRAAAPADPHSHDEHAAAGPRGDIGALPSWTSKAVLRGHSLASRSAVNAKVTGAQIRTFSSSTRALDTPDFSGSRVKSPEVHRAFSYFLIGSFGAISAASARSTVTNFLSTMSASSDVLALAKVEVDMANIPEGKNAIIKWRGKPVFVRHRTQAEIDEANDIDVSTLRDPEADSDRAKRPEWLVMLGVCTHLGCVPIGEAGEYGGWFCPCHGSHYDISGRIRKGPAPLNLEVPEYDFNDSENKLIIG
ncbi:Similar to S.cerevisiae protein RIP1 (Ubiquinol-cytochrome-c reductase) [Malassezia sympodialis ATCC 42132]|uniref:Cytochrome b-c1 complex subunit Rieske, mitochondrial n=1 Tax=Malassezia sympodialis (strain ATCC 42132) TaxID=1230383 RepID=A0A1M8A029_MALS4|nr:Similar to S.cerevisiae protein RIP1 (Ubiquinol-cytochrome-c reductase) [Malassezia sympodialis ATCC 42132]